MILLAVNMSQLKTAEILTVVNSSLVCMRIAVICSAFYEFPLCAFIHFPSLLMCILSGNADAALLLDSQWLLH